MSRNAMKWMCYTHVNALSILSQLLRNVLDVELRLARVDAVLRQGGAEVVHRERRLRLVLENAVSG